MWACAGTNVHVLLENLGEARASSMAAPLHKPDQETPVTSYIIPLAIRSKAGLAPLVEAIRASPGLQHNPPHFTSNMIHERD